jgi:hypothetical protein
MMKPIRIIHKMLTIMLTINRISPFDLLVSRILNGMILSTAPYGKGLGLGTRFLTSENCVKRKFNFAESPFHALSRFYSPSASAQRSISSASWVNL